MSDATQNNEALDTAELLDAQGRVIDRTGQTTAGVSTRVEDFIRAEPIKAAFIALILGYIIGRLKLIV